MSRLARAIGLAPLLLGMGATDAPTRVFAEDFEGPSGIAFARRLRTQPPGQPLATVVRGTGVGGGSALRITYAGNAHGSARVLGSFPLSVPGDDYTLSYDVRLAPDFPFVEGGKLHGLAPLHPVTGGRPGAADGWSARVMWRRGGRAETYTYHQDQPDRYGSSGTSLRRFRLRTGRWQAVSLHVRLNTPARARNGFVRLYVDGRLVSREERLRLRGSDAPGTLIATFLFSTFHGGDDPSWAPRTRDGGYATTNAMFDNVAVDRGARIRVRAGSD